MVECHFKDNDRISKLTCCKCFKTFASRILLYHHMIRHRKPNFECDLCGKKSNDKFRLKNHLFTHFRRKYGEDSKEFKKPNRNQTMCYVCSKMVDSITDHVYLRHSDEKRFKCNEPDCSFASKTKRSLQQHQNLHTGSRPHVCEFCGKKFATQGGLSNHRIRHINPEKFKCQTCGECFAGPESLKSHKARLHAENDQVTEVRPHACSFEGCVSSFASERNLKVHVKNVHNSKFKFAQKFTFSIKNVLHSRSICRIEVQRLPFCYQPPTKLESSHETLPLHKNRPWSALPATEKRRQER